MSFEAEQKAIEQRFAAQWAEFTPVAYMNVPFTTPNNTPWVRLTVLTGDAHVASMGSTKNYRNVGIIDIGIFTPIGSAALKERILADRAAVIFRGAQFEGISCKAPSFKTLGVLEGWEQANVSIPFYRDEIF